MDKKIEIFENTLLKLLVRRGLDVDRQQVKLSTGELGYTTDTQRLYVGDGQTNGGKLAGNLFIGSTADVTTLSNVCSGDFGFDNDNNKLYSFIGGSSNTLNNWREIGGVYTANNGTITISNINKVQVGTLSAGNFASDALGNSLTVDSNLRVALSSTARVNRIINDTSSHLEVPSNLKIGDVSYNWPSGGIGTDLFLKTNIDGNLTWTSGIGSTSLFVANTAGLIPVGTIMPFVSSTNAPPGWLLCNGQQVAGSLYPVLSSVIGTTYGGNSTHFNVPNFINRTLYGVGSNPASSTLFRISSGTNTSLSASGVLYVIKAVPDNIIQSSITIQTPLTATNNGVSITNTATSILSSNINVGLPRVISGQTISGLFTVDDYGRVVAASSNTAPLTSAGVITNVAPQTTPVINNTSPISFLRTPVTIYENTTTSTTTSLVSTISAYPNITRFDTGAATGTNIPLEAKNIIVDCSITTSTNNVTRYVTAAANTSLLGGIATLVPASTEYIVSYVKSDGPYSKASNFSQVILPLSANSTGNLTCAFRLTPSNNDAITVRIVGYTL